MSRTVQAAVAGVVATLLMTVVLYVGKWLGLFHTPPPKEISARAEEAAGTRPTGSTFSLNWLGAHLAFGALAGAVYPWVRRGYPGSGPVSGALYGLSVWFLAYVGVLPELGLYPDPVEDSTARQAVLVAAHVVYGATVGRLCADSAAGD
jgi:uncharacterized membrane protein YagU involved in acid resistance